MSSQTLELELTPAELLRVEALAARTQRTPHAVALEAVRRFLDLESWQVQDIQDGIAEADAGDFATADEVQETFRRYGA